MNELTPKLLEALAECEKYERTIRGGLYWWREASMKKLEAMGLVEQWLPKSVAERPRMKARPYRVTEAGRTVLQGDGRPPAAPGRAGDPSDLSPSGSQPSGRTSLTQE